MSFSAAAARNFQFFLSVGGGCQKALGNRRRRLGNFNFFSLSRRRLKILLIA
jgi:hypothetical protein